MYRENYSGIKFVRGAEQLNVAPPIELLKLAEKPKKKRAPRTKRKDAKPGPSTSTQSMPIAAMFEAPTMSPPQSVDCDFYEPRSLVSTFDCEFEDY